MSTEIGLSAALNKLRQAELLSAHLGTIPAEISSSLWRAGSDQHFRLTLETYFFACLSAARSVYFIFLETGGPTAKRISSGWRNNSLDQDGRTRFNAMLNLRDRDVHYGDAEAETLPKMIEFPDNGSMYNRHSAALFGPAPMTEHINPDGSKVSARALRGSIGLYIDMDGRKVEATTACAEFIEQLRSLLHAAERG